MDNCNGYRDKGIIIVCFYVRFCFVYRLYVSVDRLLYNWLLKGL